MRNRILLYTALVLFFGMCYSISVHGMESPRIVFVRDMKIWMSDLQGTQPEYLVDGFDPEISPDGKMLPFTDYREGRKIAVLHIDSGDLHVLDTIPGDNNYGPRWSPDGDRLVFNYWKEMDDYASYWVIATIRPDGSELHLLTEEYEEGLYSPFWAEDGLSLYAQDLHILYQFDLEGNLMRSLDIADIVQEADTSSATRFSITRDGSRWLFEGLVLEEEDEWQTFYGEPVSAVFIYNSIRGVSERITPPQTTLMSPDWVQGEEAVLVFGYTAEDMPAGNNESEMIFNIYRLNINAKSLSVVVENGMFPSGARK